MLSSVLSSFFISFLIYLPIKQRYKSVNSDYIQIFEYYTQALIDRFRCNVHTFPYKCDHMQMWCYNFTQCVLLFSFISWPSNHTRTVIIPGRTVSLSLIGSHLSTNKKYVLYGTCVCLMLMQNCCGLNLGRFKVIQGQRSWCQSIAHGFLFDFHWPVIIS